MSKMLIKQQSVKLYEYEEPKPDLEDVILHYNHNHSPIDGKFTSGPGGSSSGSVSSKKKKKKGKKSVEQETKPTSKSSEQALKEKDLKYVQEHVDDFSTKELNDLLNRINAESRLDEAIKKSTPKQKSKKETAKKIISSPAFKLAAALAISSLSYASYEAYKGVTAPTPRLTDKSNPYYKQFVKDMGTGAGKYAEKKVKKKFGLGK